MPLPDYVAALRQHLEPQRTDWFAYKLSEPKSQATVARSLSARTGLDWDPADVAMTNGGFAALAVAFRAILEPGDEVVFLSPPWFFYEILIRAAGGVPVRVPLAAPEFDLDPATIAAAITPRTRAVLLNSPHNPSGRVYPLADLQALAGALAEASRRIGRQILLISDEPYNRIVFDGRAFHSPAEAYPDTIITYSYGKTLLAPGMRIGYLTVPPTIAGPTGAPRADPRRPARDRLRLPERAAPARDRGPREAVDRRRGARATARSARPGAAGDGLRSHPARRHVLHHGPDPIDDDVAFGASSSKSTCSSCPGPWSSCPAGSGSRSPPATRWSRPAWPGSSGRGHARPACQQRRRSGASLSSPRTAGGTPLLSGSRR